MTAPELITTLTRLHAQALATRDRAHRLGETYRLALRDLRLGVDPDFVVLKLQKAYALPATQSDQVIGWEEHDRISADGA